MVKMNTHTAPELIDITAMNQRLRKACIFIFILSMWGQSARAQTTYPPTSTPDFAELEAAGLRIGKIHIIASNIFNTSDQREDKFLFQWANALHIQTHPDVIERALLFKTGDIISVRRIEETERLLRANRYLYDAQFRPINYRNNGVVDIEVTTKDTWSLDPGISISRAGGANSSGIKINEFNALGTGTSISLSRSINVDRSSNAFQFSNARAFGTLAAVSLEHASNSDGKRDAASVIRPFYALDARWAAGVSALKDDRVDAIYESGKIASQYRHRQKSSEVFGGWSAGLVGGWVKRYSIGIKRQFDAYAIEPNLVAPTRLPKDDDLIAPFFRLDLVEDRYEKKLNHNLIGRPEFFAMGVTANARIERAATALGSGTNAWLYSGAISRGFEPIPESKLITSASISGRYVDGQVKRQQIGAQAQYYLQQNKRWLFFASANADLLTNPDIGDTLELGGDNGLRGYPLRYQNGTRRLLLTAEERFYTDVYLWQLFRFGGAMFFDAGRAWGGSNSNTANSDLLGNAGFGLRIVSTRAAFSNVLHVDFAFPLKATPDIKKMQFLVKTKTSF